MWHVCYSSVEVLEFEQFETDWVACETDWVAHQRLNSCSLINTYPTALSFVLGLNLSYLQSLIRGRDYRFP